MAEIGVSILETGNIRIRPSARTQTADRSVFLRRLRMLTDRGWTDPLPIYSYLISHPEGHVLFDTGMSPRCIEPGYFPWWMPTINLTCDIQIKPNEGIGSRLKEHGLTAKDLKAVVLSHLHHDHAGGLADVEGAPIYLTQAHWDVFKHPFTANLEGAVPSQWPAGFAPRFLEPTGGPVGPWEHSYPITSDGRIVAVDTPGHVPGHVSLIVFADAATYFLTGDATYDLALLDAEQTDGINDNPQVAVESVRKIKEFARQRPLVVLPAHESHAVQRLRNAEIYKPTMIE